MVIKYYYYGIMSSICHVPSYLTLTLLKKCNADGDYITTQLQYVTTTYITTMAHLARHIFSGTLVATHAGQGPKITAGAPTQPMAPLATQQGCCGELQQLKQDYLDADND